MLDELIKLIVLPTPVVLDLGCGIRPQDFFNPAVHICCEPYSEYLEQLRLRFRGRSSVLIPLTAQAAVQWMPDKSVDSIFLLDFIEHLEKSEGEAVLRECERIARCEIVLFTPLGFMPQQYDGSELDAWGMHGTSWQTHRSGWLPDELGATWRTFASENYHTLVDRKTGGEQTYGAFWGIRRFADAEVQLIGRGNSLLPWRDRSRRRVIDIDRQVQLVLPEARRRGQEVREAIDLAARGLKFRPPVGRRLLNRVRRYFVT